ncbi:MAG: tetratricopeptide repeat protein [Paludibacteraceae bacterium]|nr:tetratricopeptide repeat protein [Paludibacteraceae bacterium]
MNKNIIILLILVSAPLTLFGASMESAAGLYAQGDFQGAVEEYETILSSGWESATLYYNLGNSYFRLGQNTKAILSYERALKIDPTDDDIRHNLVFAKERTVDKIDTPEAIFLERWWADIRNIASADTWSYASIGLFTLFIAALLGYIFMHSIGVRKASFSIAVVALFFCIITFSLAYQQNKIQSDNTHAIILAQTVTIKSTPDSSGTDLFILHEGTKVQINEYVGSWAEISTEDGSKGWIDVNQIEVI